MPLNCLLTLLLRPRPSKLFNLNIVFSLLSTSLIFNSRFHHKSQFLCEQRFRIFGQTFHFIEGGIQQHIHSDNGREVVSRDAFQSIYFFANQQPIKALRGKENTFLFGNLTNTTTLIALNIDKFLRNSFPGNKMT